MAAIAMPPARRWVDRQDGDRPAPGPAGAGRPAPVGLGVGRPTPAVYRRRRMAAVLLVLIFGAAVAFGLQAVLGGFGGGPLTTTGAPGAAGPLLPVDVHIHVVQPGDTLWSIARALSPGADPRPIVDRLVAARHGRPLQVGERVLLP